MKLIHLVLAAIIGLFSTSIFVCAQDQIKKSTPVIISTELALKQYVVTFRDEVSASDFEETSKWITDNKGQIVESINENFAKLIIAKMDSSILKLSELKPNAVESVEEDDLDWDDHAEL